MADALTKLACDLVIGDLVDFGYGPLEVASCYEHAVDYTYVKIHFVNDDGPGLAAGRSTGGVDAYSWEVK